MDILVIDVFLAFLFLSANFLLCFSSRDIYTFKLSNQEYNCNLLLTPFFCFLSEMFTVVCHAGLETYSDISAWGTLALPTQPGSPGLLASSASSAFLFLHKTF